MKTSLLLLCCGDNYPLAKRAIDSFHQYAPEVPVVIGSAGCVINAAPRRGGWL